MNLLKKSVSSYILKRRQARELESKTGRIHKLLAAKPGERELHKLFGSLDDWTWHWTLTEGAKHIPALEGLLPTMPSAETQARYTGAVGFGEAYDVYQLFKRILNVHGKDISRIGNMMDFGCGWSRYIRLFLKDVPAKNIYGVDVDTEVLKVSQDSNLGCNLSLVNPMPPSQFADNTFDFIYAYSVFSHISEESHLRWLAEFKRILKPGGVVIATTRARGFILECAENRKLKEIPFYMKYIVTAFPDTAESLRKYDAGEYTYSTYAGLDLPHYGEACIPRKYVYNEWCKYFSDVDFIDAGIHRVSPQHMIVAQK
jgi:ubiquinone/menaquinone biosynthesis C-methylase UbiE